MKNAVATLRFSLNIPEHRVKTIAGGIGCDPENEGDEQTILEVLQSEIEESPADWLDYATSEEVEVDA
jgi:hypothetical protein